MNKGERLGAKRADIAIHAARQLLRVSGLSRRNQQAVLLHAIVAFLREQRALTGPLRQHELNRCMRRHVLGVLGSVEAKLPAGLY